MNPRSPLVALALAAALAAPSHAAQAATPDGTPTAAKPHVKDPHANKPKVVNRCLDSVPDPGTTTPVKICYTMFRPARAKNRHKIPMLIHSHGWGGSRTKEPASFKKFLDAGYAVLSFDQRGFGESGGHAYVENPDVEGHDVRALVDRIARWPWVKKDRPGDPRLGAIGGSYGGGYQFLAAFEELRLKGKPIFDALAPEITWNDLANSLAPSGVVRTEWALALSAASVPSDALPQSVYKALVEGSATGQLPDGSVPGTENLYAFFEKNGPRWHVGQGRKLDIPVLFGQGTTDTLFPLEQGLTNWHTAITKKARRHSIFIGYNGGHTLPALLPQGVDVASDPCSKQLAGGSFADLSLRFFDEQLKHKKTGLDGYRRIHLATPTNDCVTVRSDGPNKSFGIGDVSTPTTAGVPLTTKIADGPITVAGSPTVTASVTSVGVDTRIFYGLAIGTNAADAKLVQNNVLPLRELTPVTGQATTFPLPSVAVKVPPGKSLFLLATPVSDTFVGMGSRPPGLITLADTVVRLPVL
jgi:ABC-2 type transport system ATP-binding protein